MIRRIKIIESKKDGASKGSMGIGLGITIGFVLTGGAIFAILVSGLGGHGNPKNPIAEIILYPGLEVLGWGRSSGITPKGAGPAFLLIAFTANVGTWALVFRWLVWPLVNAMRRKGS